MPTLTKTFTVNMGNVFVFSVLLVVIPTALSTETDCIRESLESGEQVINCNYQALTAFPRVTVESVTELNVVYNQISALREGHLSGLVHLARVNLSHNALSEMDQRAFRGLWQLQSVDLSYNQLTIVHSHTFYNMSSLRFLYLANNHIQVLGPESFKSLSHLLHLDLGGNSLQQLVNHTFLLLQRLTWLSVSANRLDSLQVGAFSGLTSLTFLDLTHNYLEMSSSAWPPRIFAELGTVKDLHVEFNAQVTNAASYPECVFSDLVSLRRLTIDTFPDIHFGQDFKALRQIETLDVTSNCQINIIHNNSLEGFKNSTLSEILFDSCPVVIIEACAFCDLPSLQRLRFSGSDISPLTILKSLYGLQHQTMTEISLITIAKHIPVYIALDHETARYLRNICVATFNMIRCGIYRIASNVVTKTHRFSHCIEYVDLSENSLVGDVSAFLQIMASPRLRSLSLHTQNTFSLKSASCLLSRNTACKMGQINDNHAINIKSFEIQTAENLTYLSVATLFPHVNPLGLNITFPTAKRLKTLDVSYIGLASCGMTFYGLENLETLNMKGNICNSFTDTAFDFMTSLTSLNLSSMILDKDFMTTRVRRVFQKLSKLQKLDLSHNNLVDVDPYMLHTQTALRELDLSGNRLQGVSICLGHLKELRSMDLSGNMLTTLTPAERHELDILAERQHVSLKLQDNPLVCSCANLDLVPWLWTTAVSLDGEGHPGNYTCSTETGLVSSTEQVMAHWLRHWRACVGGQIFTLALSAFMVQILGLIITLFVARTWTQIYYAWKAIRIIHLPRRAHFKKDAFLVYADVNDDVNLACVTLRQALEDRHCVRLLLRNRDEVLGGHVAENIIQHIDDSWKVVLLVTQAFFQDDWSCGFAVTQAQRSISASMPDRIIILFFEDPARLPAMPQLEKLLRMVPERNVLYIRRATSVDHPVWGDLAGMILDEPC